MATARKSKYFSGDTELAENTVTSIDNSEFEKLFPGASAKRYDSYAKMVGRVERGASLLPLTRIIYYSRRPSLHKCDARCMNAKGHNCECSCGGKNHGING